MAKLDFNCFGQHFIDGEFEKIYIATSKQFQQLIGLNEFQNGCHAFNNGVQRYELVWQKDWFGTTQMMWVDEKREKGIQLTYDQSEIITGLYVKQFVTYASDKIWTKNKYRMPICDEWFVFWGGTNEFENYHYVYEGQRYAYDLVRVKNGTTFKKFSEFFVGLMYTEISCSKDLLQIKQWPSGRTTVLAHVK